MQTPIPPAGYKLVKGEEIKNRVPDEALFWTDGWVPSLSIGQEPPNWALEEFYAIPAALNFPIDDPKGWSNNRLVMLSIRHIMQNELAAF